VWLNSQAGVARPLDGDQLEYLPMPIFVVRLGSGSETKILTRPILRIPILTSWLDKHSTNLCRRFVRIDRSRNSFSVFSGRSCLVMGLRSLWCGTIGEGSFCVFLCFIPFKGSWKDAKLLYEQIWGRIRLMKINTINDVINILADSAFAIFCL